MMEVCYVQTFKPDTRDPGLLVNLAHATAIEPDGSCAYFDLYCLSGVYDIVPADRAKALRFAQDKDTSVIFTDPDEYLKREV